MNSTRPGRTRHALDHYLFEELLPLWRDHGWDREHGGFHERLSRRLEPQPVGYKRLVVQCRQLYTFSHGWLIEADPTYAETAHATFEFLDRHYWDDRHGGWYFSVRPDGEPWDRTKDTYGHAFVLFACAYYHRAFGQPRTLARAGQTLELLEERLADPEHGGFFEGARDDWSPQPATRRQNPHMHLLEGFLAMYEASRDSRYEQHAERILDLFRERFFRADTGTLGEFYDDAWNPHPEQGHIVEPGHHFEWVWLLHQAARITERDDLLSPARRLYDWAFRHGTDPDDGGVLDEVDHAGQPLRRTRRIWPLTECLKACAAEYQRGEDERDRERLRAQTRQLRERYLLTRGRWNEHLGPGGERVTVDLPGSTSYHIFQGIREACRVLAGGP